MLQTTARRLRWRSKRHVEKMELLHLATFLLYISYTCEPVAAFFGCYLAGQDTRPAAKTDRVSAQTGPLSPAVPTAVHRLPWRILSQPDQHNGAQHPPTHPSLLGKKKKVYTESRKKNKATVLANDAWRLISCISHPDLTPLMATANNCIVVRPFRPKPAAKQQQRTRHQWQGTPRLHSTHRSRG